MDIMTCTNCQELKDEIAGLEAELDDFREAEKEKDDAEVCNHCRQPIGNWTALLAHYDDCEAIRAARKLA